MTKPKPSKTAKHPKKSPAKPDPNVMAKGMLDAIMRRLEERSPTRSGDRKSA